jgi:hypothetical protein
MKPHDSTWITALGCAACLTLVSCNEAGKSEAESRTDAVAAKFPGAGRGGAGLPIASGIAAVACDQPGPLPAGSTGPVPSASAVRECYYDADHPDDPAAIMEWIVEASEEGQLVHARLTFNPRFVDNSYGANAIGWGAARMPGMPKPMGKPKPGSGASPKPGPGGHTFKDLVGSDHAEFTLTDARDSVVLKFKADYLSETDGAPAGYASLGVTGGEGKMLVGAASDVAAVSTSLERNLNVCGYPDFLVDSPATDAAYTANPSAPNWDFRVVYDVWVKRAAFGDVGFGSASVQFVHASPSKAGKSTLDVVKRDCPPGWPPYCADPAGCEPSDRCGDDPDESCTQWPPKPPTPPSDRCGDDPDESCTEWPACDGGPCPRPERDGGLPLF